MRILPFRDSTSQSNKIQRYFLQTLDQLTVKNKIHLFSDWDQSQSQLQFVYNFKMDELKSFKVTPQQRQYFEHIQCFNLCVKDYKDDVLNATQKNCLKSCFKKYQATEKFFLNKLNETMEYLAINDPALRSKFEQSHKKLNK